MSYPKEQKRVYNKKPRGRYVYAWLDDGAVFYIGQGVDDRMIKRHKYHDGADYPCQIWRDKIGDRFTTCVVRDNLTDEGASLVESVLIDIIRPACNTKAGMGRRERPPLILPRNVLR